MPLLVHLKRGQQSRMPPKGDWGACLLGSRGTGRGLIWGAAVPGGCASEPGPCTGVLTARAPWPWAQCGWADGPYGEAQTPRATATGATATGWAPPSWEERGS